MKQLKKTRLLIAALAAGAAILLSACGNNESAETSQPTPGVKKTAPEPSREIVIEANDQMRFNKTSIAVAPGETVRLTLNNVGTMPKFSMGHNLVILDKAADIIAFAEASAMSPANEYVSPDFQGKVIDVIELDVRELLEEGRSPLSLIINTVESLDPGQRLRLLTAWEPHPLYQVLGNLGFEHKSRQQSEDLWIIEFTRSSYGNSHPGFNPPCIL